MLVLQRRLCFWTNIPMMPWTAQWAICTWENDFTWNLCSENCYAIVGLYCDCTVCSRVSDRLQTSGAVVYLINWSQACGSNDQLNTANCTPPKSTALRFFQNFNISHHEQLRRKCLNIGSNYLYSVILKLFFIHRKIYMIKLHVWKKI